MSVQPNGGGGYPNAPRPSTSAAKPKPKFARIRKPKANANIKRRKRRDPNRKKRQPNMFLLYFMDMYRKYGGNHYTIARECGRRWGLMTPQQKDYYKQQYTNRVQEADRRRANLLNPNNKSATTN